MNQPILTFRSAITPYALLSSLDYVQTKDNDDVDLPIKEGECSDLLTFRIYNNWGLSSSIASATGVALTTYDNSTVHSRSTLIVSQSWVQVYESGFGQSTVTPGAYSQFVGLNTAIGRGGADGYTPEVGSDGSASPVINAGADNAGVGFIECKTYLQVPAGAAFGSYSFVLTLDYFWTS